MRWTATSPSCAPGRAPVMAEMEALADRDGVPIVSWETGRLLSALAAGADGRVLEVGTAIGYSALHMAEALEAGSITTLERDPERIAQARDFLDRAGQGAKVEIVEGDVRRRCPPWRVRSTCCSWTRPRVSTASTSNWPDRCWRRARCWPWTTS